MLERVDLPNFLIVGAAKSGTTSLCYYLGQHPEVYVPRIKEPHFFVSSIYKELGTNDPRREAFNEQIPFTLEDYTTRFFGEVKDEKAIGEASVAYLYYYDAAIHHIKSVLGEVKIIIILRNPIDRAFSAYTHLFRDQFEVLSFERCLELEQQRKKENWSMLHFYKDAGLYYEQVKAYIQNFDWVRVYLYDDLKEDALKLVEKVFAFLEVDDTFVPDTDIRYNVSGVPKSRLLHRFLTTSSSLKSSLELIAKTILTEKRIRRIAQSLRVKNLAKPKLELETREYLQSVYREDITKLESLIHRDLSCWLE